MAKPTQKELNLGYCEEAQTYCSVAEERYKQGRQNAERDFRNSDYWNDYLAKVIKNAKADAIDEFVGAIFDRLSDDMNTTYLCKDIAFLICRIEEQLKDQKKGET